MTTTPRRGRALTDAASSIAPTGENTFTRLPSLMPSAAASSGWMTTSLRFPDGCSPGSSFEPRVHRVTVAPVRQLERIVRRCFWARLGEQFADPLHELRWRCVHFL